MAPKDGRYRTILKILKNVKTTAKYRDKNHNFIVSDRCQMHGVKKKTAEAKIQKQTLS